MRVGWSAEARTQLREIQFYIAIENPEAASATVEAIGAGIARLLAHPMLGRPADIDKVRVLTIPRTPYRVYYSVSGDRIWIISIWHGARQWPPAG